MSEVTTVIACRHLPAFVALGWRVLDAVWPVGRRGVGEHARIQWAGNGDAPWPQGWEP